MASEQKRSILWRTFGGDEPEPEAVFIAGKVKKWRGSLVGVDSARIMRLAQEAREAVMRRGNFQMNLVG